MRGVVARVYLMEALDDAIPLYPVYPVLFAAHGLSTAQISALFLLWAVTGLTLQLPTGALADRAGRRTLLVVAGILRSIGYALWVLTPGFAGFAAGFVLWGAGSALIDGTFEALVYDELAAAGATELYGRLTGRAGTVKLVTSAGTTALAIPLLGIGGFGLLGAVSSAVCVVWALIAATLPARRRATTAGVEGGLRGYARTLRAGVSEAMHRPPVRGPLLLAALLPALTAIDEYTPLLGPAYRMPTSAVPLLLLAITLTAAAGTWAAGRWWAARPARLAAAIGVAAIGFGFSGFAENFRGFAGPTLGSATGFAGPTLGSATGFAGPTLGSATGFAGPTLGSATGFAGIALGFGLLQYAIASARIRLQHAITGPARATVTSVADLVDELGALAVFAACGAVAGLVSVPVLIALFALPAALLAVATPRWLRPTAATSPDLGTLRTRSRAETAKIEESEDQAG